MAASSSRVALAAAVLDHQLVAADDAEAGNRRRREDADEAVSQARVLLVQAAGDLLAVRPGRYALVERLQHREHDRGVRHVDEAVDGQARERHDASRRRAPSAPGRPSASSPRRYGRARRRSVAGRCRRGSTCPGPARSPVGMRQKLHAVSASRPANSSHHQPRALQRDADAVDVAVRRALEQAVEGPEDPAERLVDGARGEVRRCASCGFSSSAASAGDSVSELNAEITVEIAIVSANCW